MWFVDHGITVLIGIIIGWILFERPQWVKAGFARLWQWIMNKVRPNNAG
jgi:hypothetical protein